MTGNSEQIFYLSCRLSFSLILEIVGSRDISVSLMHLNQQREACSVSTLQGMVESIVLISQMRTLRTREVQ